MPSIQYYQFRFIYMFNQVNIEVLTRKDVDGDK